MEIQDSGTSATAANIRCILLVHVHASSLSKTGGARGQVFVNLFPVTLNGKN